MRRLAIAAGSIALALASTGCEMNGARSARDVGEQIIREADRVCSGKTANIGWLEGRTDDVVITCMDGSNHFYDG